MRSLYGEMKWFLQQKCYCVAVILTGICAFGFAVTHPAIGIDDTAIPLYFSDGLAVVMGRWTLFLINKVFYLAEFTPFMPELVGVFFLLGAVVLFCVLLRRLFGDSVGIAGYTIFSCVFISNPIISETYVYYLHNGTDLGYVLTALALLCFMDGMENRGKKKIFSFVGSMLFIWSAAGCYESFLILYIMGILVILFLRGMAGKDILNLTFCLKYLGLGALLSGGCVLLRSIMVKLLTGLFGLQEVEGLLDYRSLSEMLVLFNETGIHDLFMLLKRSWVVYHLNAVVYLPVTIYEAAVWIFGIASLFFAVKKKNFWYPLLFVGMYITPLMLTVIEARPTQYRSCQYLPFYAAVGIFLGYRFLAGFRAKKAGSYVGIMLALCIVWNNAFAMNKSFYVDYLKYEHTKDVLFSVVNVIEKEYGRDIPVVFTGHYDVPHSLTTDFYVPYYSWQYRFITTFTDLVDPHLKDKYNSLYGYSFVGEVNNPFIQWAFDAFDGTNSQMIVFLQMHGYSLQTVTDRAALEEAWKTGETMPGYPMAGSVINQGDYIIVHF